MAAITLRTARDGSKSYRVEVRLKGYPAQRATFSRLTDARRWAQATEAAMREGRHFKTTEAKRRTVADLIDEYTEKVLSKKKPGTQRPQIQQLAWWRERIGRYTLADVTKSLIEECLSALEREPIPSKSGPPRYRSPATVNRYLAAISHAFTRAVDPLGWIEKTPCRKSHWRDEPSGRVRFLDDDERERLLDACRQSASPDLYAAVVLALSTGARQQEILGLRWGQIDLTRKVATLHETKNGEQRVLPLAGPAMELLKVRAKVRRLDTDLVFPGRTRPPKPVDLRTPFETALKVAGIENFRWHDLRHTAASYLAMNGATLPELAEILGHKGFAMVKRYSHLSEAHTASVVEKMNKRMLGDAS